jgi:NADP-dependent alcohol dehydrogenase
MQNFSYQNPVRVVFGKGAIAELATLVPLDCKVLLTYGGGSIMKNGVYAQVKAALKDHSTLEFGGIEPNPQYDTLMKAAELSRRERVGFLLAVGGGSVLDGTKFIAAAIPFEGGDPWDILAKGAEVKAATPLGSVLTLPATGSEMNYFAVVSRESTTEKCAFGTPLVYPRFSILDPETTYTLPPRQVANGVVDAFVHVCEQYLTQDLATPLQDRQAEAVLATLIEEGPKALSESGNYDVRANIMWSATQALNGNIACGVLQDWATHMIGHELTALYGIDHARSLAVVQPSLLRNRIENKQAKLCQLGRRVWGLKGEPGRELAGAAIDCTEEFYRKLGVQTRLSEYGIPADAPEVVARRFEARDQKLGELADIGPAEVQAILTAAL